VRSGGAVTTTAYNRKKTKQINFLTEYMDYRKSKAPVNTVTRDIMDLSDKTGNIYESVAIISKRANQIASEIKQDLTKKLAEFASYNDSLEEVFENREQIEISRYYEKLPKPTLLATEEFLEGNVYFRDPSKEAQEEEEA
jgi:DNA-directed RNA polymerase subunit K/omega